MTILGIIGAYILAGLYAIYRIYVKPYRPKDMASTDNSILEVPVIPESTPIDKIKLFAKAQEEFEGWFLPGSVHNGIRYPEGSSSYVHKNPGNLKDAKTKTFITFPSYEAGFLALEDYIHRVALGNHKAYPKGGQTTFMEYTHIYTGDPEPSPTNYANHLAKALNVPTSTTLSYLLT